MTGPSSDPAPALVVFSNPEGLAKASGGSVIFPAVMAVSAVTGAVVTAFQEKPSIGALVVVLGGFIVFLVMALVQARRAGADSVVHRVATLDTDGLHATIASHTVSIPWSQVASIRRSRNGSNGDALVFAMVPNATAQLPELGMSLPSRDAARLLKRGFTLTSVGIDVPLDRVAETATALSGNRLGVIATP